MSNHTENAPEPLAPAPTAAPTEGHTGHQPIAVVGVSALFPGSTDASGFWTDILAGRDLLSEVPPSHWLIEDYYDPDPSAEDKTYARRGGFLPKVDFDALSWGVPPSIIPATDTAQLLALMVAEQVLTDAWGSQFREMDKDRMSCILGVTSAQELLSSMTSRLQRPVWIKAMREAGLPESRVQQIAQDIADHYTPWQEATFPGLLGNVVAGRIANRLDLGGTNCVTDAACASTFSALHMAVNELYLGDSDVVIAGGVDTMNEIFMYMCFSKTPALSRTGDCRPFSDQADGTMLGEGLAMVALKRLADAEADGDRIYAVVEAVGSSSDGRSKSVYAPVSSGQAKSIRRAYARAGYGPDTVELVEAHGTGTKAGDAAEFGGLQMVFDESGRTDRQWCALGSVKSQIGHTKAAAGAAGLFKAVMAVHHKTLPPTAKVDRPNPKLDLEASPFHLATRARPWVRGSDHPRRAGVSSFGFGGSNFHVAVQEYVGPQRAGRLRTWDHELIVLRAESADALADKARALADDATDLRWTAWSTAGDPGKGAHRLAIVAADLDSLRKLLRRSADQVQRGTPFSTPDGVHYGVGTVEGGTHRDAVAFLFPGQGSQYLDMGAAVAMNLDVAADAWAVAADTDMGDQHLHAVVFPPTAFDADALSKQEATLTSTQWAQPAIGATSLALLATVRSLGLDAAHVAGHSYGEVTALHAAGRFSAGDTLRIARRRGELMAEAAKTPGAMTAIAGEILAVRSALEGAGLLGAEGVVIANHNHPTQVVLSGPTDAIERAEAALQAQELVCKRLAVSTAFHSPVVSDSAAPFTAFLGEIELAAPTATTWCNATAAPYDADADAVRTALGAAVAEPVHFVDMIEAMYAAGVRSFIEIGPGNVLTRLTDRILGDRPHVAVDLDRRGRAGMLALLDGVARLVVAGHDLDLRALWAGYKEPRDPASVRKPKLAIPIDGANQGKPYPPTEGAAALPKPNPEQPAVTAAPARTPAPPPPAPAARPIQPAAPGPQAATHTSPPSTSTAPRRTPAMTTPSYGPNAAWLQAFQDLQRQTAEAHASFQRAMADSHAAFLQAAQTSIMGLTALSGALPTQPAAAMPAAAMHTAPTPWPQPAPQAAPQPTWTPTPVAAPVAAPAPAPVAPMPAPVAAPAPAPVVAVPAPAPVAAPAPTPAPTAAAPAAAPTTDVSAVLLDVVADKTGYPAEMLALEMDLEGDLGVDSIKRVEILSAMKERVPGLPEVDPAEMGALRTLGQIVDKLGASTGAAAASAPVPAPASAPAPAAAPAAPAAGTDIDVSAVLLDVVADKTGYPAEMLALEMDLEGDLGVDSIKRVEILSAMKERVPGLPEVDPAEMGALRTLGQIVDKLGAEGAALPFDGAAADVDVELPLTIDPRLGRFELRAEPAPAPGLVRPLPRAGTLGVVGGPDILADALVAALQEEGQDASRLDMDALADADLAGLILLHGLADATADVDRVHLAAFEAARAQATTLSTAGGLFVTVQDTGGDFGLSGAAGRAWLSGFAGLARTAAQEWPRAIAKAIDIERGGRDAAALGAALAREILAGGPDLEVGLRADGQRLTLRDHRVDVQEGRQPLGKDDVIVVSGGGRGVTAATVVALAWASGASFLLLGRTPLSDEPACCADADGDASLKRALLGDALSRGEKPSPVAIGRQVSRILANREIRRTLASVEEAGGRARYASVDVTNSAALGTALDAVRADWGPVTGLVHGAGVLRDKLIADKSSDDFALVWRTKIGGLRALLDATQSEPLRLLAVFSSVAARCGNQGQVDYAMANEVLNKVAQAEALRRPDCVVKSFGWGPWEGGMVTPALKARFESLGVPLIPLDVGARMLVDEVASPQRDAVGLVFGGRPRIGRPLAATGPDELVLAVDVSRHSHPWLADHAIQGVPVVPVVLAVEWFARAARAFRSDLHLAGIEQVKVLRGVRLQGFDDAGDRLLVVVHQLSNGDGALLSLELRSASGTRHYSALARMQEAPVHTHATPARVALKPWGDKPVYGDILFHGPRFQVIRDVQGMSSEGGAAVLDGVDAAGWSFEPWQTDVAALDGGLQLALLWTEQALGGRSLPTGVGRIRLGRVGHGRLHAVLKGRKAGAGKGISHLVLVDDEGVTVAELNDVETHLLPSG